MCGPSFVDSSRMNFNWKISARKFQLAIEVLLFCGDTNKTPLTAIILAMFFSFEGEMTHPSVEDRFGKRKSHIFSVGALSSRDFVKI